jgi:hypothetical protein
MEGKSSMYSALALLELQTFLTNPTTLIPVTGGVMTGFAIALFRGSIGRLFHAGTRESDSLMNFSSMGTLRCICGEQHPAGVAADRRQFCRQCGCEVVAMNTTMVDKHLSKREIKEMTSSLRRVASRASHLELPPTISSISELHEYLESSAPRTLRTKSRQPTQIEQPQIH